ncbi:hypothetical protein ACLOJK_032515 [Asimina triloba]
MDTTKLWTAFIRNSTHSICSTVNTERKQVKQGTRRKTRRKKMLRTLGMRCLALGHLNPSPSAPLALARLYHERVVDHYNNPRNVGSFDKNDPTVGTGLVGAPACGDVMKLQIKVDDQTGKIVDACFKTFGCGSAIASSSVATEWVKGKQMEEVLSIKNTRAIVASLKMSASVTVLAGSKPNKMQVTWSVQIASPGSHSVILSALDPDRLVVRPSLNPTYISPANPQGFVPAQRKPNTHRTPPSVTTSLYAPNSIAERTSHLANLRIREIAKHLSLPPVKLHCSMLAEDAIKAAIKDYEAKKDKLAGKVESSPAGKAANA